MPEHLNGVPLALRQKTLSGKPAIVLAKKVVIGSDGALILGNLPGNGSTGANNEN